MWRSVLLGKYNDCISFDHQQEEKNYRHGCGPRLRRTFYNRRAQQSASEASGFNTKGQQTHGDGFLNRNGDTNCDGSWQERQMKRRDHACSESNWQEQNGYNSSNVTKENESLAYSSSRQLAETTPDHSDYESDLWHSGSTESAPFSPSICSNSSIASSTVVPSSPIAHEDSGEEVTAQRLSGRNIWKERLEFYHSAQPRTEEEENIMVKRALEESKKLEEERQRRILDETTNHIHALSVDEFETTRKEVDEESELVTSTSSPVGVDGGSLSTSCEAVTVQSDNDHVSTSSCDDAKPSAVPETCALQDRGRPCASTEEVNATKSLPVLSKSEDGHSPSGLVAFCQSDSSAFTSFITAKHASSPVVVQGCDQRLRNAASANQSSSRRQMGNSTPDYDDPAPTHSPPLSHIGINCDQPYYGSDEASQTSADSQVSECYEASSYEQNSMSPCAVYENFSEVQSAVYEDSAYIPGGCNRGVMTPYPPCVPVPVPALPPRPPCYYPPVPGMTYPYQPAGPAYMNQSTSYYSSGVSVMPHHPYPTYPVMSPSGMMPPAGMMPMGYPPMPAAVPCCPSYPGPAPCYPPFPCCHRYHFPAACYPPCSAPVPGWVPRPVMCRPMPVPLPPPMQPDLPW